MRHPGVPEALRGTYAGLAQPAAIAHLQRLGVTAVSLLPVQQHLDEQRLVAHGPGNYWGYNTLGFFCRRAALRQRCRRAVAASGIPRHGATPARRRHRSDPRRRLQPHRRRPTRRPDYQLARPRQRLSCYRAAGRARPLRKLDAAAATRSTPPPPRAAVGDGQPALLGARDARRWLPLRPGAGARPRRRTASIRTAAFFTARARRTRCWRGLQADRRALGHRPRRLSAGPLPARLAGVERPLPRRHAQLLAGRGVDPRRVRAAPGRSSDLFHVDGRAPAESVNFIVAHDGFTLRDLVSYEHKHNQANGEDNRDGHGTNHELELRRGGPDRRRADIARCAAGCNARCWPRCCWRRARRCSLPATSSATARTATTTPTARTTRPPGSTGPQADEALIAFTARVLALRQRLLPLARPLVQRRCPRPTALRDLAWLRDARPGHAPATTGTIACQARRWPRLIGAPASSSAAPLLMLVQPRAEEQPVHAAPGRLAGPARQRRRARRWRPRHGAAQRELSLGRMQPGRCCATIAAPRRLTP